MYDIKKINKFFNNKEVTLLKPLIADRIEVDFKDSVGQNSYWFHTIAIIDFSHFNGTISSIQIYGHFKSENDAINYLKGQMQVDHTIDKQFYQNCLNEVSTIWNNDSKCCQLINFSKYLYNYSEEQIKKLYINEYDADIKQFCIDILRNSNMFKLVSDVDVNDFFNDHEQFSYKNLNNLLFRTYPFDSEIGLDICIIKDIQNEQYGYTIEISICQNNNYDQFYVKTFIDSEYKFKDIMKSAIEAMRKFKGFKIYADELEKYFD